jgi:molybdate transport system substrate-binding protein
VKVVVALALVLPLLASCGGDDSTGTTTLTVLAASSLTDAFNTLGPAFEDAHPDTTVTFSFAGSTALVEQADNGAPGDVIATADRSSFDEVDGVGPATVIARNRLAILVERGNPKDIRGLDDLAATDVTFVMCVPAVPCGKLGARALELAEVSATPKSVELNVKGVVSKVTLGEADAGIVYVTDVHAAAGDADGVDIDIAGDPALEAVYPMGVLEQSSDAALAQEWIDFVAGSDGQAALRDLGFLPPG